MNASGHYVFFQGTFMIKIIKDNKNLILYQFIYMFSSQCVQSIGMKHKTTI